MKKVLIVFGLVLAAGVLAGCSYQDSTDSQQQDGEMMNKGETSSMKNGGEEMGMMNEDDQMDKQGDEMEKAEGYMDISPEKAKMMIDDNPDLIVVDVSPKYAEGHLPGAVNYYVGDGSLDKAIPSLDKNATYLVYCHVDSASILGSQKLVDAGFENVYRLEGNYNAWVDAGYPVEK